VPQNPHRRNRSGFSSPHDGHVTTGRVYDGDPLIYRVERRLREPLLAPRDDGCAVARWRYVAQFHRAPTAVRVSCLGGNGIQLSNAHGR
jgi:hypothetical protein